MSDKYRRKTIPPVYAFRLAEGAIPSWANGKDFHVRWDPLRVFTTGFSPIEAFEGDWLVRDRDFNNGHWRVMTDDAFHREYEPLPTAPASSTPSPLLVAPYPDEQQQPYSGPERGRE